MNPITRTIKPPCVVCGERATMTCADCGKRLCCKHSYLRIVDGNNSSITQNSGTVCRECHPESKQTSRQEQEPAPRQGAIKRLPSAGAEPTPPAGT